MRYVSVKIESNKKKQFVRLLKDLYSDNDLLIEKDTICEIGKVGKKSTIFVSPDEETIILDNQLIDKFIEFI